MLFRSRLRRLPAAQVLKGVSAGLGQADAATRARRAAPLLLAAAGVAALLPGLWTPYLAMLLLVAGALAGVPWLLAALGRLAAPWTRRHALPLLAAQRAADQAGEAGRQIAGVLVALALAVAMLVMVHSFRLSLSDWLERMLPADLYLRSALRDVRGQVLPPALLQQAAALPGVARVAPQLSRELSLARVAAPAGPGLAVQLLARELPPAARLPLQGEAQDLAPGQVGVYINEALRDALDLRPGDALRLQGEHAMAVWVRGVWRDYSRQSPALLMQRQDWLTLGGDAAVTELALWLTPDADEGRVQAALRRLAGDAQALELASSGELRRVSLQLFERSFAITAWLQAVALGLGLFGVATGLSAQLLARRREFGLLLHLGLTRAMLRRLVLGETLVQTLAGAGAGLLAGLAISALLVFQLNPRSFHWSMDWHPPWPALALLLALTLGATLLTAAVASALALRRGQGEALRAVREDW